MESQTSIILLIVGIVYNRKVMLVRSMAVETTVPYILFLILFMVVPLVVIMVRLHGRIHTRHYVALVALLFLSIYIALWSNFTAARGVQYFDGGHILGITAGFLPFEHYLFLVLQVGLVGAFLYLIWRRLYPGDFE
jgi:lycopene cyclase domain-containing protein